MTETETETERQVLLDFTKVNSKQSRGEVLDF